MIVLGVESSCDETSVAVYDSSKNKILSSSTFSQDFIHSRFGGVIPEVASRNHIVKIRPLFDDAIATAKITIKDIDLIGVTVAPGLIGALFVGVNFAKGLGYSLKIPVLPIHHLSAHMLSAEMENDIKPPYIGAAISGGHTHIFDIDEAYNFKLIARTIDDACGEVFDKVAKVMGGIYPGGRYIEELATKGDRDVVKFPIAFKNEDRFSFSGLKTSVINVIRSDKYSNEDIAASFQFTVAKTLADKIFMIAFRLGRKNIVVGGGVASNKTLRSHFLQNKEFNIFFPSPKLCTDNADMIAYAAYRLFARRAFSSLTTSPTDTMNDIR